MNDPHKEDFVVVGVCLLIVTICCILFIKSLPL